MNNIIKKAKEIAFKAHNGQRRKTENTPYISHPLAVAKILEKNGFSDEVVAAGLVHDVIEDSNQPLDEVLRERLDLFAHVQPIRHLDGSPSPLKTPNGTNINDACGSQYPEILAETVLASRSDIGFAFDDPCFGY